MKQLTINDKVKLKQCIKKLRAARFFVEAYTENDQPVFFIKYEGEELLLCFQLAINQANEYDFGFNIDVNKLSTKIKTLEKGTKVSGKDLLSFSRIQVLQRMVDLIQSRQ
jgi:hypothetical protein